MKHFRALPRRPRRRRRGVALFDFLLYLTIAAVVVAGAVLAYNNVDNRQKRLATAQMINEIYAAVADLHRGGASYGSGSLVATLDSAKMIPSRGRREASGGTITIVTPFGDDVAVEGDGNTFSITVSDMTEANCLDLVTNYADQDAAESALSAIEIGGTAVTMPATVATLSAACDDDDDVELTFR